uniref:Opioid growth factor receptor-like 1 n=1 Tax=Salarias fasciatus TaxID=181472 RepID=A0A672H9J2_SALFA
MFFLCFSSIYQLTDSPESAPKMKRSFYAARDLYKYRHSYPTHTRAHTHTHTHTHSECVQPLIGPGFLSGIYIEEILSKWRGDYDKLEHNHTYIQWLFPLREQGLNFYAHELTQDEIKVRGAKRRFLAAYSLMLDFYGIKLLDKSGNVARASNWQERFQHLNESHHNYLRITRILKSLGELGYEAFKAPLVRLFLEESLCQNTLPNMQHSVLEYYVYTIRLPATRRRLLRYARQHYRPAHAFLWGPPPKRRGDGAGPGGSVGGAGSSGIRAPAPTPDCELCSPSPDSIAICAVEGSPHEPAPKGQITRKPSKPEKMGFFSSGLKPDEPTQKIALFKVFVWN